MIDLDNFATRNKLVTAFLMGGHFHSQKFC